MQAVTTIGFDIAKSVFQVHGVDAPGQVIVPRQLKPRYVLAFFQKLPPCLIGIEACASSHHWPLKSCTRHLFIRQQTAVINAIRANLAEFGIIAPVGRHGVEDCRAIVHPFRTIQVAP